MTLPAPKSLANEIASVPDAEVAPKIRTVKFFGGLSMSTRFLSAIQDEKPGFTRPAACRGSMDPRGNTADLGTFTNSLKVPANVEKYTVRPSLVEPTQSVPGMCGRVLAE